MKKISMILMAFALAVTMSQCKKNEGQPTSNDEVVTITLDVTQNNGSRVVVNPSTGTVDFETGDKIYVGSGGKYVGFLTHNGTNFVGNITNPIENQPLQFYFLGNVTPTETLAAGTTEECSVIISDQTEHLPAISCAASYENYVSGVTSYSAHLLNKCALVKFNVTTPSNSPICITGMHNKVTVDFTQNTVMPSIDDDGVIMLPAGSGENVEKWAILLPQEALEEGEEGSAFLDNGSYIGIRPALPVIRENDYLGDGFAIIIDVHSGVPTGAINGLFSVSELKQVWFSQGNLQYQASTNIWRFAEHQWDYVGGTHYINGQEYGTVYENGVKCDNSLISSTYSGWIDLFGWGTSGYHDANDLNNIEYEPWSTNVFSDNNYFGYGPSSIMQSPNLTESSANYDWGVYNTILNGGNRTNQWRTLTNEEWNYVLFDRNTSSSIRFAKAIINDVSGVILLPDDWSNSIFNLYDVNQETSSFSSNIINASIWENMEQNGAVFLPAAGLRYEVSVYSDPVISHGRYWTSSFGDFGWPAHAYELRFCDEHNTGSFQTYLFTAKGTKCDGESVRLVQDY